MASNEFQDDDLNDLQEQDEMSPVDGEVTATKKVVEDGGDADFFITKKEPIKQTMYVSLLF